MAQSHISSSCFLKHSSIRKYHFFSSYKTCPTTQNDIWSGKKNNLLSETEQESAQEVVQELIDALVNWQ